jgi:hypothetical protein
VSAGWITPIEGGRWSVHDGAGKRLAVHACAAMAQIHLLDFALREDERNESSPAEGR